jgi:hypothetical protein
MLAIATSDAPLGENIRDVGKNRARPVHPHRYPSPGQTRSDIRLDRIFAEKVRESSPSSVVVALINEIEEEQYGPSRSQEPTRTVSGRTPSPEELRSTI